MDIKCGWFAGGVETGVKTFLGKLETFFFFFFWRAEQAQRGAFDSRQYRVEVDMKEALRRDQSSAAEYRDLGCF